VTSLDLLAARDELKRPRWYDPGVAVLEERGFRHEASYLDHLKGLGLDVQTSVERTADAMKAGTDVIAQANLGKLVL
jgi:hypothetical protein